MSNLEIRIRWADDSQTFTLVSGRSYSFGRSAESDLRLDAPFVSRSHGTFVESGGAWVYRQVGTTTPTLVDGVAVTEVAIGPGVVLSIAGAGGAQATISVQSVGSLAPTRSARAVGGAAELRVTVTEGSDSGRSLSATRVTLGREPGGAERMQLTDPRISRAHASVKLDDAGRVVVRDLGSQNGTTVSGSGEQQVLRDSETTFDTGSGGLVVRLGDSAVRVEVVAATGGAGGDAAVGATPSGGGGSRRMAPLLLAGGGVVGVVGLLFVVLLSLGGSEESNATPTSTATAAVTATAAATAAATEMVVTCDLEETAQTVIAATVLVLSEDGGIGTAFHVGEGVFVTAAHVTGGFGTVFLDSERISDVAEVLYADEGVDVAVIQLQGRVSLPALNWSNDEVPVGRTVATVGYPAGAVFGSGSLSRGAISKLLRRDGIGIIQTDVPVNPGNSGGALIDECGVVLGVVVQKLVDVDIEGIGYAVDSETAQAVLERAMR